MLRTQWSPTRELVNLDGLPRLARDGSPVTAPWPEVRRPDAARSLVFLESSRGDEAGALRNE